MKFSERGYQQLHQCSAITCREKPIVSRRRDTNFLTDRASAEQNAEMFESVAQIFTGKVSLSYSASLHHFILFFLGGVTKA